ncbi:MAG: hypothetical protein ACOH1E_02075 [Brevundimonas sp.]
MIFTAGSAAAQNLNSSIADFNTEALRGCYTGEDLGSLLNMSNPLSLIGSVGFTQTLSNGTTRLRRMGMALPYVVTEAAAPDQTTCSLVLEVAQSGAFNILGVSVQGERSNVFKIQARLITRQALSTVVQNGQNVALWEASEYATRFRSLIQGQTQGSDFFLVDNISVYLVTVERYRKAGWTANFLGLTANFGGNASYRREETFTGARILVTADTQPLSLGMFPSGVTASAPPIVAPTVVQDLGDLPAARVDEIRESLNTAPGG